MIPSKLETPSTSWFQCRLSRGMRTSLLALQLSRNERTQASDSLEPKNFWLQINFSRVRNRRLSFSVGNCWSSDPLPNKQLTVVLCLCISYFSYRERRKFAEASFYFVKCTGDDANRRLIFAFRNRKSSERISRKFRGLEITSSNRINIDKGHSYIKWANTRHRSKWDINWHRGTLTRHSKKPLKRKISRNEISGQSRKKIRNFLATQRRPYATK